MEATPADEDEDVDLSAVEVHSMELMAQWVPVLIFIDQYQGEKKTTCCVYVDIYHVY